MGLTKVNGKHTRLYGIYTLMKQRCYNPHKDNYYLYGGRGIKVCDAWKNDFKTFYDWAYSNGYTDKMTIDRINVNGNYEPSNCRWITMYEQQSNKRNNVFLTFNGKTQIIQRWSEELGISAIRISRRLKTGWSVERALTEPINISKIRKNKSNDGQRKSRESC